MVDILELARVVESGCLTREQRRALACLVVIIELDCLWDDDNLRRQARRWQSVREAYAAFAATLDTENGPRPHGE